MLILKRHMLALLAHQKVKCKSRVVHMCNKCISDSEWLFVKSLLGLVWFPHSTPEWLYFAGILRSLTNLALLQYVQNTFRTYAFRFAFDLQYFKCFPLYWNTTLHKLQLGYFLKWHFHIWFCMFPYTATEQLWWNEMCTNDLVTWCRSTEFLAVLQISGFGTFMLNCLNMK